jgi:hypothetical protein
MPLPNLPSYAAPRLIADAMAQRRRAARLALAGTGTGTGTGSRAPPLPPPPAMAVCLRPTAPAALAPAAVARQIDVQVGALSRPLSSPYLASYLAPAAVARRIDVQVGHTTAKDPPALIISGPLFSPRPRPAPI